jgi:tetratricopeptide (TPR) repeat protein
MILCPSCGRELTGNSVCRCGTDLTLLKAIIVRADHLFNRALTAYRAGQVARALEYLEANAVLAPFDVEARIVQAKLLAQSGRWDEAEALIRPIQGSPPELAGLAAVLSEKTGDN